MAKTTVEEISTPKKETKAYSIVFIHGKLRSTDTSKVPINVNGNKITVTRKSLVALPNEHIEALRHALHPVAKSMDDSEIDPYREFGHKEVEMLPRFAFEVRGQISEKTYLKLREIQNGIPAKGIPGRALTEQEVATALAA